MFFPYECPSVLKYITGESTLGENADALLTPDKALMDKEKELLDRLKVLFYCFKKRIKFLMNNADFCILIATEVFLESRLDGLSFHHTI